MTVQAIKNLSDVVRERAQKEQDLKILKESFEKNKSLLEQSISELKRIENLAEVDLNITLIQLAESVLRVEGNPYGNADCSHGQNIAECAIIDIANGAKKLKTQYFGNKTYGGYYQRCDCEYGYGPTHGGIVDRIGLKAPKNELTLEEQDACIYYLKNYAKISASKVKP